jgi:hypothetical protein
VWVLMMVAEKDLRVALQRSLKQEIRRNTMDSNQMKIRNQKNSQKTMMKMMTITMKKSSINFLIKMTMRTAKKARI